MDGISLIMEQKALFKYRIKSCYVFFQLVIILNVFNVQAQNLKPTKLPSEAYMYLKNKQFSEFVERFNYESDFQGNPIDSVFKETYPRDLCIKMLFNQEKYDEAYFNNNDTLNEFLRKVCDNSQPLYIERYSSDIKAKCICEVIYKGKNHRIVLYLNQEVLKDNSVKWVLSKAEGILFLPLSNRNDILVNNNAIIFIPPSSNEVNFLHLKQLLKKNNDVFDILAEDAEDDQLIILLDKIQKGEIIFNHVKELTYEINAIHGYRLVIENFNRPSLNSGWLISVLLKL